MVKYYGIKEKLKKEEILYRYSKTRAKIYSILPGTKHEFWKRNYEYIYCKQMHLRNRDNSLPNGHKLDLHSIIVADLIRREDIKQLQKGLKKLLLKQRSGKIINAFTTGLDELCNKIEQMDSTLPSWCLQEECGAFEFKCYPLMEDVDFFSLSICNINSAFLALKFEIYPTEKKRNELNEVVKKNYIDVRGYACPTLSAKKMGGAFKNYSVVHYNNEALKADQIYEFLSIYEWNFMEELSRIFPFVLHGQKIMPPRIEIYYTDIEYSEKYCEFWSSIGISAHQGQFIDERHKLFFEHRLSKRYEGNECDNRLIYIIKDDGIDVGRLESVKDDAFFHMEEYSIDYFRILFLYILSKEAGKSAVKFKQKLDKIKLQKNRLLALLKLKYKFSYVTDDYSRYIREENIEKTIEHLNDIFDNNEKIVKNSCQKNFISYIDFCNSARYGTEKVKNDIDVLLKEFDDKKQILQNMHDYKNTQHTLTLNYIMFLMAAVTLFFLVFPEKAETLAEVLKCGKEMFMRGIKHLTSL